jgi:hypothetical protein
MSLGKQDYVMSEVTNENWGGVRELDISFSDKTCIAIRGYTGNEATLL